MWKLTTRGHFIMVHFLHYVQRCRSYASSSVKKMYDSTRLVLEFRRHKPGLHDRFQLRADGNNRRGNDTKTQAPSNPEQPIDSRMNNGVSLLLRHKGCKLSTNTKCKKNF